MACSRCQREVYIPCFDTDECEELKAVQYACDHDWEDIGKGEKQCTYADCQKIEEGEEVAYIECSGRCGKVGEPNYDNGQFYCGGSMSCCP